MDPLIQTLSLAQVLAEGVNEAAGDCGCQLKIDDGVSSRHFWHYPILFTREKITHLQMLPSMHRGSGLRSVSFSYSQATFQLELS